MFIDEAKVYVKAGSGGMGCISFRREKCVPKGGPDGGNGGRGGSIWFVADDKLKTLMDYHYRPHLKAPRGNHGSGANRVGKSGEDIHFKVPLGTVIRDYETGELIADMVTPGLEICIAKGGKGGRGNASFVSSTHQAPREAEDGELGEEKTLLLELKLLADVGLVGFPNAGKSTLLSRISRARPKIADYPFTTLNPILGQVYVDIGKSFVVADLPGLIENAHQGVGLGHEFLRHIERTRVLIHVVDANPVDGTDPMENFKAINRELVMYNALLETKPQIVVLNKLDIVSEREALNQLKETLEKQGYPVCLTSASTGEGIQALIYKAAEILEQESRKPAPGIYLKPIEKRIPPHRVKPKEDIDKDSDNESPDTEDEDWDEEE